VFESGRIYFGDLCMSGRAITVGGRVVLSAVLVSLAGGVCSAQSYSAAIINPAGSLETFIRGGGQSAGAVGSYSLPIESPIPDSRIVRAFVFDGSNVVDLHPTGFSASYANRSRNGQQVGFGFTSDPNIALLWTGTAESVVQLNNSETLSAVASDTDGQTQVGAARTILGGPLDNAYAWQGTPESGRSIHPPTLFGSAAFAIRDGAIVETGEDFGEMRTGVYWPSLNDQGQIVRPDGFDETFLYDLVLGYGFGEGYGSATGGPRHAMLFNLSNFSDTISLHPADPSVINTYARSARAFGTTLNDVVFVGSAAVEDIPGTGETDEHAVAWVGPTTFVNLHRLLPTGFNFRYSVAQAVDESGKIYGFASDLQGLYVGVVWTPQTSTGCSPADIANTDGDPGSDGAVDNGDFSAFFTAFFLSGDDPARLIADVANTDGEPGADGVIDNGDFTLFFAGCAN
jgi:hypothetical protein